MILLAGEMISRDSIIMPTAISTRTIFGSGQMPESMKIMKPIWNVALSSKGPGWLAASPGLPMSVRWIGHEQPGRSAVCAAHAFSGTGSFGRASGAGIPACLGLWGLAADLPNTK